jgi:hypothetical protein
MLSTQVKASIMAGLLFFIIANPETFKLIRRVVGGAISSPTGCPTGHGLALHSVVFAVLTYFMMQVELAEGDDSAPAPDASGSSSSDDSSSPSTDSNTASSGATATIAPPSDIQPVEPDPVPYGAIDTSPMLSLGSGASGTYQKCSCEDGSAVLMLK